MLAKFLNTREESAFILSISVRSVDYHIARQRLRVKHHGSKVLIPHPELVRFAREDHPGPVAGPALKAA